MKTVTLSTELSVLSLRTFEPTVPAVRPGNFFENATRRAHLVNLTRKAFVAWSEAAALYTARITALHPSAACIEESAELSKHRLRRYNILESRLADETGLDKFSVFNSISEFPLCSRLLRAGL